MCDEGAHKVGAHGPVAPLRNVGTEALLKQIEDFWRREGALSRARDPKRCLGPFGNVMEFFFATREGPF